MHPSSVENMRRAQGYVPQPWGHVVEVGGGRGGNYRDLWRPCASYTIADIDGPRRDYVMADEYNLSGLEPDVIVSGQTLEHVRNPFRSVEEMARVLRPGGYLVLIAPSAGPPHDDPDCWRFGRDAFRALADECGLETLADWIYTGDSGGGRGRKWDDHVWVGRKP